MASNRSATETARDALVAVARHTARIQIAALGAAGCAFAGWAHATDEFAQSVGGELLRRIDGESDSRELIACVASATDAHLHDLTALPRAATDRFDTRLVRASTDN